MKVRLTLRAERDLREIADFIAARNPRTAFRVEAHLLAAFRLLAAHPGAGRRYRDGLRRLALPRYPYLIFYDCDEAAREVWVLSIRHAKRRDF